MTIGYIVGEIMMMMRIKKDDHNDDIIMRWWWWWEIHTMNFFFFRKSNKPLVQMNKMKWIIQAIDRPKITITMMMMMVTIEIWNETKKNFWENWEMGIFFSLSLSSSILFSHTHRKKIYLNLEFESGFFG